MPDSRRPGSAFAAPSHDRQPAEVRLIWGCDSKDKAIMLVFLSQGKTSSLTKSYVIQASWKSPHHPVLV